MGEDILDKISELLNKHGSKSNLVLYKEDAVAILDLLSENLVDDMVLLRALRRHVESAWSSSNDYLKESMEDVLAYYGIIEKEGISPKMVMEKRGDCIIKRRVEINNMDDIKGILDK